MTIGDGLYPDHEIADALRFEVLGRLPWGPDAADALVTLPVSDRQLRLAPLIRSARSLRSTFADKSATGATVEGPTSEGQIMSSASACHQSRTHQMRAFGTRGAAEARSRT